MLEMPNTEAEHIWVADSNENTQTYVSFQYLVYSSYSYTK